MMPEAGKYEDKKQILIVGADQQDRPVIKQALEGYQVMYVSSGIEALSYLEKQIPDLILLYVNMPEMDGRETLKEIRKKREWKVPVIFLTADNSPQTEVECLELGADDFIAKPFIPEVMRQRISRILELWALRYDLEKELALRTRQIELAMLQAVAAIVYTIDVKDPYTHGHSIRVAKCSVEIVRRFGWQQKDQEYLFYAALMHDIGKIGVPDLILKKAAPLTEDEMEVMKRHPIIGAEIAKELKMIHHIEEGACYHHEKYDGTGYPYGLKGGEIPLSARVICVADTYDAMTTDRPYRKAMSNDQVIEEIRRGRGTQFDPEVADIFLQMLREGYHLDRKTEQLSDLEGEQGIFIRNMIRANMSVEK